MRQTQLPQDDYCTVRYYVISFGRDKCFATGFAKTFVMRSRLCLTCFGINLTPPLDYPEFSQEVLILMDLLL